MASGTEETVLGRITAVFGVKGWLKVHSYTDPIDNILDYKQWVLHHNGRRLPVTLAGSQRHGKGLIVLLKGVEDRNQAQEYCGADIAVDSAALPVLPEGEYYWHQLEGLEVVTDDGLLLGKVDHLIETGANDVLVVRSTDGSMDDRERLIPYLPEQVVIDIDLENNRMTVAWDPEF
jgi:16S rRNA processing protein RimM